MKKYGLDIPDAGPGIFDEVSVGAMVHRLSSEDMPFREATMLKVYVSGGEFNVAANLAHCFGLNTCIATSLADYCVGELIRNRIQAMGVKAFIRWVEHGAHGPNNATVYSDCPKGVRAPVVDYNRSDEAAAMLKPGDLPWDEIFANGVRWFHSGGIYAALSETTSDVIIEGMKAAGDRGAVRSFDINFRPKLWAEWGGKDRAVDINRRIVENVEVLVGNEEDLQLGLGIPGPDVEKKDKLDPSVFIAMIDSVREMFPQVKVIATTLRKVHSSSHHTWSMVAWINGEVYQAPVAELESIRDRVGGGDGDAAGLIYGLLSGMEAQELVNLAWAHGALLTTTPGDTTMVTLKEVKAFAGGGGARIQR